MLSATASKRLEALSDISKQGKRINGLFRLMEHPALWLQAYANIYANCGATTKGVDTVTMDGFSDERVQNLITLLKEGRYAPKPVRRVYIPKANGKLRPLGVPSGDDKLVQEVVRLLLERIYEPIFSARSHGFRPGRSCHTALAEIERDWDGVKWLIDVDIQGFFDNLDHDLMLKMLENKIDDQRFLKLIKAMLKAGYLDAWTFHTTYSGTPQGGIASPLLANIYLHALDMFMEEIRRGFTRGHRRATNVEYTKCTTTIRRLQRDLQRRQQRGETDSPDVRRIQAKIKDVGRVRRTLPAGNPSDPQFRRLYYCRYADDFVVGIIGSKQEARQVFGAIQRCVEQQLHLTIATEKSGIRHAEEGTIFLGYEMRVYSGDKVVRTTRGIDRKVHTTVRSVVQRMQLHIPEQKIRRFCQDKGYGQYDALKPTHRPALANRSDVEIILAYNTELRGFANYYALALNAKDRLKRLHFLWKGSLLRTLANKHRSTVGKWHKKLRVGTDDVYKYTVGGKEHRLKLLRIKDLAGTPVHHATVDKQPSVAAFTLPRTEIVRRFNANTCEYCGKDRGYFEVHHVRKLKDIAQGKALWQRIMAAMRRKTLVLCVECHDQLHHGTLPDWRYRRKKVVESRIH